MTMRTALRRWSTATTLVLVAGCSASPERETEPVEAASSNASDRSLSEMPAPDGLLSGVTAAVDTSAWTTYRSSRYRVSVGHPPDWTVTPARRGWTRADAGDASSPAHDVFESPSSGIRVSVWKAKLDPTARESVAAVESWVEGYCESSGGTSCSGIADRSVDLCLEKWDCHPGLLVPFDGDVQAFVTGGIYSAEWMTVVAVWQAETAPAVTHYGGSERLLEAFLSTMQVWPASTPREERECYGRPPWGLTCEASISRD